MNILHLSVLSLCIFDCSSHDYCWGVPLSPCWYLLMICVLTSFSMTLLRSLCHLTHSGPSLQLPDEAKLASYPVSRDLKPLFLLCYEVKNIKNI